MYDNEMVAELKRVANDPQERCQYILMERIRPPIFTNYFVRADQPHPVKAEMVSEMGVLGYTLRFVMILILSRLESIYIFRVVASLYYRHFRAFLLFLYGLKVFPILKQMRYFVKISDHGHGHSYILNYIQYFDLACPGLCQV